MAQHWMMYWHRDQAEGHLEAGGALNHIAGGNVDRIKPGEIVWIVSATDGELFLYGRFVLGAVTNQKTASRGLKKRSLFESPHHALARKGTAEKMTRVSLANVASDLRFDSPSGQDRLAIKRGRVNPQQLQVMRRLQAASAERLQSLWESNGGNPPIDAVAEDEHAIEGMATEQQVLRKERSGKLRRIALERAKGICEVCRRDFSSLFNGKGMRALQVHHRKQLSEMKIPQKTTVSDLAVVCANCHSWIHIDARGLPVKVEVLRRRLRDAGWVE